ncbi:MAG: amidohydrolase family protein [Bryobacteraceae bacterium]|jgi:L-fucono-1,5-lactonase
MPLKLDSHQHFWKYSDAEYGWIEDPKLRRDFLPDDLHKQLRAGKIDGSISVQARQTTGETEWLLSLAARYSFLKGVVGWVPLTSPTVEADIEKFASDKKLKAVRHVVQDEPDDQYILREDFNAGVALLDKHGLAYDILIFDRHLPYAIEFVDRHPKQRFILDHIAKPRIREGAVLPWRDNLREMAKRPNVWCKISGVVTEADHKHWTEAQLRFYIDTAIDAFGPKRIMFGSDWPVCLSATTYQDWRDLMHRATQKLSESEQAAIFGGTAAEAYRIPEKS